MSRDFGMRVAFVVAPNGDLAGEVFDPDEPSRRFAVELVVDGEIVALTRADRPGPDTPAQDGDDGNHAFVFATQPWWAEARRITARLANLGAVIGKIDGALLRAAPPARSRESDVVGWIEWAGGLTLRGALVGGGDETRRVDAVLDGRLVGSVAVSPWLGGAMRPFTLMLSADIADGTPRRVEAFDQDGRALEGSPVSVAAGASARVEDALRRCGLADEGLLFEQFRAVADAQTPIGDYRRWRELYVAPRAAPEVPAPIAGLRFGVVILGEDRVEATLGSIEATLGDETPIALVEGDPASLAAAQPELFADAVAEIARSCDLVLCLPAGARLHAHAADALRRASAEREDATLLYWDVEIDAPDGPAPLFFTPFDGERLLEQGQGCLAFAIAGGAPLADADYDSFFHLVLSLTRRARRGGVGHVPCVLCALPPLDPAALTATLRAAAGRRPTLEVCESATPFRLPALRIGRAAAMTTTAILWGDWSDAESQAAREALLRQDGGGVTHILHAEPDAPEFAAAAGAAPEAPERFPIHRDRKSAQSDRLGASSSSAASASWRDDAPALSSRARRLNAAAASCGTDAVLFLGPGVLPGDSRGLAELAGRLAAARVAAAGALLASANGEILSAGLALGPSGERVALWRGWPMAARDPHDDLVVAHEALGLDLQAMLVDRRRFSEIGGFDARRFPDEGADLDYCLRARKAGYRALFTPHARWIATRSGAGVGESRRRGARADWVARRFRTIWTGYLQDDAMHNPNLGRSAFPREALAIPPRSRVTRWVEAGGHD